MRTPPSVLLTTSQAAAVLSVGRDQLDKLVEGKLIQVAAHTPGGQRRLAAAEVLELARIPYADLPAPGVQPDLGVHLRALRPDDNGAANQRTYAGYRRDAAADGLTAKEIEDAWVGLWGVRHPGTYVGAALVGLLSGFVVQLGTIVDWQRINGKVRFNVTEPTPEMIERYSGKRVTAVKGPMIQPLSG